MAKQYKPLKGKCPRCEGVIEAPKPPRHDQWVSFFGCPQCRAPLHKITSHWKVSFFIMEAPHVRIS